MTAALEIVQTHAQAHAQNFPRSLRLDEVLALRPPDMIIKGHLPARGLVFIYGPPKNGKTFFALDMCLSLARGEAWHGVPTRQTGVLYVAAEGVHGLGARVLAYIRKYGHKPRTWFRVIPATIVLHKSVAGIEKEMQAIEAEEGWRPGVLVLDTLARTKGDLDENTGDMSRYITAADHFISKGMTVVVIHHPGKDAEKGLRGWSGLLGALDMQIQVVREGDVTIARWTHAKDAPTPDPFPFRLAEVDTGETDSWGDAITSCVVEPATAPQQAGRVVGKNQRLLHALASDLAKANGEKGKLRNGRPVFSEDELHSAWAAAKTASGVPKQSSRSYFAHPLQALLDAGVLMRLEDGALCFA